VSLPFLLEIGTEEIPDWMIVDALDQLARNIQGILRQNELDDPLLPVQGTPRRLTVGATTLPDGRPEKVKPEPGPLVSAGSKAVEGFARKYRVSVRELKTVETPTGTKYMFEKRVPGESMLQILERSLAEAILGVRWPKSMYWGEWGGPRFIRPIRWIVALLGDAVVQFPPIAGVDPGNVTSGHRILGAPQIPVTIDNYVQKLRENFVILSAQEREKRIRDGIGVVQDEGLLNTLVNLTEYPSVISGSFDSEYLKLPAEVLATVMRHHQKYFAVYENGELTNRFLAVTNTDGDPDGLIRRGNERVLRARFNDAKFFCETDQRKKLRYRVNDLAKVTFQAKLGSYLEKTDRIKAIVQELGGSEGAALAAELCKADLTTELVKEFTELQGVVGGLYAREQGEPEEVWTAIYDHYKPVSMEDSIPRNHAGQLVSIADKLDTLRGCFGIGLIPTGSKDPFALRRAAQGIVKVLVEGKLRLPICKLLGGDAKLEEFVLDRIRYYFKDIRGFKYDEVNAVLASGWNDLVDVEERLIAIQAVRPTEDFEPLAASFKRIRNILKQAQFTGNGGSIDAALLEPGPETDLYHEFQNVRNRAANLRYRPALESIASLRPKVDLFFDKVLVNAPDAKIRQNRLTLLHTLLAEFSTIADFSEIVTNT
jgi:glycyl-tRNA synthetase beta chain